MGGKMLKQLESLLGRCWHSWDLVPDADLDDVRTCAKCGRQDVLQTDGWHRLHPAKAPAQSGSTRQTKVAP
jgi:hypothetical protein